MAIDLLHQCGHNSNWNHEAFRERGIGDGLVLSPVHTARHIVEAFDQELRELCLFDPQYYLPSSQKQKLNSYDFFPEAISSGFQTNAFSMHAIDSAKLCVEFQMQNDFRAIVIPTRYIDQMVSDFREQQELYTVQPFLEAIEDLGAEQPIYLSIVMTSHMVKDKKFRTDILNWVTSFQRVDGVYLIPDCARQTKQIDDEEFLYEFLVMLNQFREVDLNVLVGYQNTEGLLTALIPDIAMTFGTFENTRIFSIDKFLVSEEERRGPRARIYLPGLFNWVQLRQAKSIREEAPDVWKKIYVPTEFSEQALASPVEPYFNQPPLYMHHFEVFSDQVKGLEVLDPAERCDSLRENFLLAMECYDELDRERIDIEKYGRGDHLESWLSAINKYWRNFLK